MGKQKYTAKEKKVSRMTRNGLVEENLATKETRKVTNSDQELPYKQKDVEQAFITSEKKKNSHKKAEKKQFSEKVQEGNPAKKEEAANSPPGKRKTQGRYRYRDKPAGVSVDSAVEIRERKEKHRSQYQRQKKKQQRLQFGKLETDGSLKKEKKTSAETDGGHFQAEKNDVSTNRKKGKQKYSRKTIKTYQEVDKAARKQEAERQNKIPKDSVYTKKTNEEQKAKVKYHLYFDKKTGKTDGKKKTLSSVPKKALKNAVYQKAGEDEEENSAVDAAHKLVRSGEWILQEHSSRNIRKNRSQIHKENRLEKRAWKSASRYQYQKYLEEHPEMQKKLIRKLIQKQRIKREYQMAYRAGKIAKETKDTSIRSVNLATKIARKAQEVFVRNVTTLISMGLLLILLLSVMTGFASCSAMFSNGISTVIASSYIADPDEIEKAELYYTQLEASLQQKINQMEARYPGKDEYRYNIGEIGHDPHTLISYLTASYGDFKFDEIKGELETIFSLQYGITVEEKSETRQETSTIQVGQSLGNVVTSGYCNCPICCGVWSGGPTASGAMPQANHTLEFTYEDEPTTFEITKSDITTGEELPGAKLKVSDSEGNVVDEWTSGSTPHIIKELEVGKKYTLTETIPADGYATAESITFVVENTADIQKVEMQDDTTKILISKVDMTDGSSEVKGAKLYILNENQEVMESWTSGDQPHYVEKLPIGTYTLLEETAPKGYIVANKVTFEIKDTGDIQGAKMEDEQAMGKVILNKTDKDTKKPMKGVEFALCDSKGKVLETLVTDSAGHAESKNYPIATFKNGQYKKAITYILKETKTLDGYQLDETEHKIQFEYVNDRTPVIEYTLDLTNKKAPEKDTPETSENQGVSTPGSHGSDATSVSNSPKTGDNTNIAIFVLALAVSAGCLGTVVTVKRKRK